MVFLHGFMGSSADWRRVARALESRFRCVVVDLPGHGGSTGLSPGAYAFEGAAWAVLDLLRNLDAEQPAIVGYSMGGRLALYLALRHPDRVSKLLLESASPGLETAEERAGRRAADEEKAVRLESGDFRAFLRDWYQQPLFAPLARDEDLLRRTIVGKLGNDPAELARSLRGMGTGGQSSLWEELPGLQVPTLAVAGELDEKFLGISRRMENLSARVRTAVVADAGHNAHAEASAEYLALLRGFLMDR